MSIINVEFEVYASLWHIKKILGKLSHKEIMSFDTETKGVYSKEERKEAVKYLKGKDLPVTSKALALQIAENSGLSFPSLVNVTHFIFGLSEDKAVVLICENHNTEMFIWKWLAEYKGLLLIHNSLFDLKLMYHRIGKFPKNYEDTQLLAKCLTNNVVVWKCKVGLKDLMGSFYDPQWILVNEYELENSRDPKFLIYCSIDGAATFKLWLDIRGHLGKDDD